MGSRHADHEIFLTIRFAFAWAASIAALVLCAGNGRAAEEDCTVGTTLAVGSGLGRPNTQVEIPILGKTDCAITGFSLAVGHDNTRLEFVEGIPSPFVIGHTGPICDTCDLQVSSLVKNEEGYGALFVLFDISYPITVPPIPIPEDTVLATLIYRVLPGAPEGPTALLNRTRMYGAPIFVSNIFSREPGETPIDPALSDGSIEILPPLTSPFFIRADSNNDKKVDISDAVWTLSYLFLGGPDHACPDAADSNDDGEVDISDAVFTLGFQFLGTRPPPPPFPDPGPDPTEDDLGECNP
jgi:hypothetical protein